jgi:hypothetical protein
MLAVWRLQDIVELTFHLRLITAWHSNPFAPCFFLEYLPTSGEIKTMRGIQRP